ncbi:hypothetical protein K469DRAFT_750490 [Zopfia rhizophila CBS 207.26]|uniref:Uncharacterized protein n=1 Tax=Zopfia rhizophila CBS 207.26 TaxID=1314779 RepID=A0A6A6E4D5_9PEZI|nr:hypothetical protein K469DRAFT_750490 [Zopfia rhizophila CBS 207.26]
MRYHVGLTAVTSLLCFPPSALAAQSECVPGGKPSARIINLCSYTVHIHSQKAGEGLDPNPFVLPKNTPYCESYRTDGARRIIVIRDPRANQGVQLSLDYFINNTPNFPGNYYGLSFVNCSPPVDNLDPSTRCPAKEGGLKVAAMDHSCPDIYCPPGRDCPNQAYYQPNDPATHICSSSSDLTLLLCSG